MGDGSKGDGSMGRGNVVWVNTGSGNVSRMFIGRLFPEGSLEWLIVNIYSYFYFVNYIL